MANKFFAKGILAALLAAESTLAADSVVTGAVNFTNCITDSKYGQKEQENFEALRKQMGSMIENTENQLKEVVAKFEDTEYLDGLSAKAEEELKAKAQGLQEELARYQNQFYQVLQHANHQMVQKVSQSIATAAKEVAEENNLDFVVNKDALFYSRPGLDMTSQVVAKMDKNYEEALKNQKTADNSEVEGLLQDFKQESAH